MSAHSTQVLSPCIMVCRLDPVTRICAGCYRHVDEIAGWVNFSDDEKRAALKRTAARKQEDANHGN